MTIKESVLETDPAHTDDYILTQLLDDVDEALLPTYRTVLSNQLSWIHETSTCNLPTSFILSVAKVVLTHVLVMRSVVGIQPLETSSGTIYHLQRHISSTPDTVRQLDISVISHIVKTLVHKLPTQLNIHPSQTVVAELLPLVLSAIGAEIAQTIIVDMVTTLMSLSQTTRTTKENSNVYETICHLSGDIARNSRAGVGNVIVTTPVGAAILTSGGAAQFTPHDTPPAIDLLLAPIQLVGHLRYDNHTNVPVYAISGWQCDGTDVPFLVAYKGTTNIDAGAIYSPHIPVVVDIDMDPTTFVPHISFSTMHHLWHGEMSGQYFATLLVNIDEMKGANDGTGD